VARNIDESDNNKLNSELEKKIDLILQQQDATQRSIANFKADLLDIIDKAISVTLNKRAAMGYSRISS
jgi:hypothetical protein